ncbi:uncharacterized protein LOC113673303 [Pocillopora damicornis]|uniref:uncharacterized protein LOC113673303 n=1 Tax=Pocillopora damicornis TaxID=46731 RepID=UPI000F550865|nr:uncharacterized protein LOC113673303 [Pocillopora damicornis]XP_027045496.1 uncharacterized protein LOC113673303 [Pocillopora damicornis]
MASRSYFCHYIVAFSVTTFLLGAVSAHFKIGREQHKWSEHLRPWQMRQLSDQEGLTKESASDWLQRNSNKIDTEESIEKELRSTPETHRRRLLEHVHPSYLKSQQKKRKQF